MVTTLAGSGSPAWIDGMGTVAAFNRPFGVVADASGNVLVAVEFNHRVRRVTPSGGTQTMAQLRLFNFAIGHGIMFLFLFGSAVTTLAGSGTPTWLDGEGTAAAFSRPAGATMDTFGNMLVADRDNNVIRRVTPSGGTLVAIYSLGPGAGDLVGRLVCRRCMPLFLCFRLACISFCPFEVVSTVAGNGVQGFADGVGAAAAFNLPHGIAVDAVGNILVADFTNQRVRRVTPSGGTRLANGRGIGYTAACSY